MAYEHYEDGYPAPNLQNGLSAFDSTRKNLDALRDSVVAGIMPGWNYAIGIGSGNTSQPSRMHYTKGTESIKLELSWGRSGGAEGNVTQCTISYSPNPVTEAYSVIGIMGIVYNSRGMAITATWR